MLHLCIKIPLWLHLDNFEFDMTYGCLKTARWKWLIVQIFNMRRKNLIGSFTAQILISLTALKTHTAPTLLSPSLLTLFPFSRLSTRLSIFLSVFQQSCCVLRLPSCLFPIVWIFPPLLILSPAFPIHLTFYPLFFFSPWHFLVFPHYMGSPAATPHCTTLWGLEMD